MAGGTCAVAVSADQCGGLSVRVKSGANERDIQLSSFPVACADEIRDYALLVIGGKVPCLLRVKRYHRQRRSANAKHACEKQYLALLVILLRI